MKLKLTYLLAVFAALPPAYMLVYRPQAVPPEDLRDAVSDSAYTELSGSVFSEPPEVPLPQAELPANKGIHGTDDRRDYYAASEDLKAISDSVVSLWDLDRVRVSNNRAALSVVTFKNTGLCPGERFAEQPFGANCSGALVGPDLVMTAGHCVKDAAACANTRFIFGFKLTRPGEYPDSVPAAEVYGCKQVVKRAYTPLGFVDQLIGGAEPDYALIQLDRKVAGHRPLRIARGSGIKKGTPVIVMGHPHGLPLKVAGGARVTNTYPKNFFWTDLDVLGGNSGGPVLNARTGLIEGILVRSETKEFVETKAGCRKTAVYSQDGGAGAAVNRVSVLENYLP